MKKFLSTIIILLGIGLGLYLGIYVLLYGGIMQVINNIDPLNKSQLVWGIIRALLCELGIIPAYLGIVIGSSIYYSSLK